MLKNLTILITTYNRYSFLKRLLTFYQSFNTDVKIIVLDSSSIKILDEELILKLHQKNILWKKYDNKIFIANKINYGCKYITTRFAVLCADDDFLFPNSLKKAVTFLENNSNYSSCLGLQLKHKSFSIFNKTFLLFSKSAKSKKSFSNNNIFQRIFEYISDTSIYYPFYAVHRTFDLKKIWKITAKNCTFWGLAEILPCCLSLVIGKMKVLNVIYTSRQKNTFNWNNNKKVLEYMYSEDKINKAVKCLSNFIVKFDKKNHFNDCKIILIKYFEILRQRALFKNNLSQKNLPYRKIKIMLRYIPYFGDLIINIFSKLNSKLKLYFINRISLEKNLDKKTFFIFQDVLRKIICNNNDIINSRKEYSKII